MIVLGENGSGKSTTALACFEAGLEYAADDHCLLSVDGSAYGHSIFATGKLNSSELYRFPFLLPAAAMDGHPVEEKVVFFLDRLREHRVSRSFSLRGVISWLA